LLKEPEGLTVLWIRMQLARSNEMWRSQPMRLSFRLSELKTELPEDPPHKGGTRVGGRVSTGMTKHDELWATVSEASDLEADGKISMKEAFEMTRKKSDELDEREGD